ncbi:hypothetical protein AX14_002706 [Amanita brunnescens Koide BX004]|nr:hypothetical protein AX14_002706 [Amanita brunnescens Koide BX004]
MTRYFDKVTKPSFKGSSKPSFVRFGRSENDQQYDIRSGSVKLNGTNIANFFEPAIQNIIKVIEEQSRESAKAIKVIFMVGGFATSDYLFSKLEDHFKTKNIDILRPDAYLNKAVAEGAIMFKLDHSVSSRVARYTYGIESYRIFNPNLADHLAREDTCFEAPSGDMWVPNRFSSILQKDSEVSEETEFRTTYYRILSKSDFRTMKTHSVEIKCYRNRRQNAPEWIDLDPLHFADLCEVTADLTKLKGTIQPHTNHRGAKFFVVKFDVVLLFGLTELKAQMAWTQNGVEKRGPASIVYDISSTADV